MKYLILSISIFLSACGGSGGDSTPPPEPDADDPIVPTETTLDWNTDNWNDSNWK